MNRDDRVTFTSFGPTSANLNRDQNVGDFEAGLDFGKRDVMAPGDALIFGVLGGLITSELRYDQVNQSFDFDGGQAGAYVTYLNRGLFVDTLFKVDFLTLDSQISSGLPSSLDATNIGARVDSGYRFGGFGSGAFFEPLATVSVVDSQIDDFNRNGNSVNFDDGTSVRGRLGLRAGRSYTADVMTFEPFVIASVWHEFEDSSQATLVSGGTLFNLLDDLQGTWGEVSAGVNVFNVGMGASGFVKLDVVFGDDIQGAGGQAGVRYRW